MSYGFDPRASQRPSAHFGLLRTALFACVSHFVVVSALASKPAAGIRVQGPGVAPRLMFACCDHGLDEMQSLFGDPHVIANLQDLHAGIAVAILDFNPKRAELVRRLNQAGVPVSAWLLLSPEQGFYFNVEAAPRAAARFAAFDAWSRDQGLRWDGVGLDIQEIRVGIILHRCPSPSGLCESENNRGPSTPRSGALYQGPTSVGPLRLNKDLGFSPCVNCLHEHFLPDAPRQGLKPNFVQSFAARLKSGQARLKSGPDTKPRSAESRDRGCFR